jgi:hypothetical protein
MSKIENAEYILLFYDSFGDAPFGYYLISKDKHPDIFNIAIDAYGSYINLNKKDEACEIVNEWLEKEGENWVFDFNKDIIPNNTILIKTSFACC